MNENEKALEKRIEILEAESKEFRIEMKDLNCRVNSSETNAQLIQKDVSHILDLFKDFKTSFNAALDGFAKSIDELKSKPGKRWDSLVGYGIAGTVGSAITYIVTHFVR